MKDIDMLIMQLDSALSHLYTIQEAFKRYQDELKVPPPSPRPKAGQKAREDLESRLMPILKKWWDGYQRQDKATTLKEYCDIRWPERGDMSLSLFLMNKVNAHRMTIPQMRTILNILEAD